MSCARLLILFHYLGPWCSFWPLRHWWFRISFI